MDSSHSHLHYIKPIYHIELHPKSTTAAARKHPTADDFSISNTPRNRTFQSPTAKHSCKKDAELTPSNMAFAKSLKEDALALKISFNDLKFEDRKVVTSPTTRNKNMGTLKPFNDAESATTAQTSRRASEDQVIISKHHRGFRPRIPVKKHANLLQSNTISEFFPTNSHARTQKQPKQPLGVPLICKSEAPATKECDQPYLLLQANKGSENSSNYLRLKSKDKNEATVADQLIHLSRKFSKPSQTASPRTILKSSSSVGQIVKLPATTSTKTTATATTMTTPTVQFDHFNHFQPAAAAIATTDSTSQALHRSASLSRSLLHNFAQSPSPQTSLKDSETLVASSPPPPINIGLFRTWTSTNVNYPIRPTTNKEPCDSAAIPMRIVSAYNLNSRSSLPDTTLNYPPPNTSHLPIRKAKQQTNNTSLLQNTSTESLSNTPSQQEIQQHRFLKLLEDTHKSKLSKQFMNQHSVQTKVLNSQRKNQPILFSNSAISEKIAHSIADFSQHQIRSSYFDISPSKTNLAETASKQALTSFSSFCDHISAQKELEDTINRQTINTPSSNYLIQYRMPDIESPTDSQRSLKQEPKDDHLLQPVQKKPISKNNPNTNEKRVKVILQVTQKKTEQIQCEIPSSSSSLDSELSPSPKPISKIISFNKRSSGTTTTTTTTTPQSSNPTPRPSYKQYLISNRQSVEFESGVSPINNTSCNGTKTHHYTQFRYDFPQSFRHTCMQNRSLIQLNPVQQKQQQKTRDISTVPFKDEEVEEQMEEKSNIEEPTNELTSQRSGKFFEKVIYKPSSDKSTITFQLLNILPG